MADKIGKALWEAFTRKQKFDAEPDDKALLKALARVDAAGDRDHESRLQALDEVIEQGKKLVLALPRLKKELEAKLKKEADPKKKKELDGNLKAIDATKDELNETIESAQRLQKDTRETQEAESNEQDEADSPALLTSKMVPLIRELRKGQVQMFSLVALAGKETVVLISKRAISPARGKLLKEQLSNPSGLKFIRGECLFEENALTFVVQARAAGLAKKLKAALLAQTELRLKVRVRGEDPDDVEEEVEEDGEGEGQGQEGATAQVPPAPPVGPPATEQLAYEQRLKRVKDRLEQALQAQHPESTRMRALIGYASDKADGQQDYSAAIKALEMLDKLLGEPVGGTQGPPDPSGADAGAAFKVRVAALIPKIKQGQTTGHPGANDAKLKASEAGVFAGKRDFQRANAMLAEAEQLLGGGGGTGAQEAGIAAGEREAAELFARLQADVETVERGPLSPQLSGQFQPIRTAWTMAVQAIEKSQFDRALLILQRIDNAGGLARLVQAMADAAGQPRPAGATSGAEPIVIWREAKEAVDERISALRKSVLGHPDEALRATMAQIADKGLNGVTDRAAVGMMAAMMEADTAPAKARQAIEKFRAFLAGDIARGIDENPFEVQVDLRRTLGTALERIESRLAA